jgi:uncharacterized protein (TIGR02996 family)
MHDMTGDERAFLDAICAQPDDDTARLVYADWLADNGDADRGEFIRVEVELARTPRLTDEDERRRRVLIGRRDELLKKHKTAWLGPFLPYAKENSFARGFVQSLDVPASVFLQHAEGWFALTPLTRVKIIINGRVWDPITASFTWWAESLFTSPLLARLEALDLENAHLTADNFAHLARQPDLPRLRELNLEGNDLRNEGAIALAGMPQLRGLRSLNLKSNSLTDLGARAIARSEHLAQLSELWISRNSIREPTWDALHARFGAALMG